MVDINVKPNSAQSTKGSALACYDCKAISISRSEFKNIKSIQGGAIFIQETEVSKKVSDKYGKYFISETVIEYCSAVTGGAIFIDNIHYMTISYSRFQHNYAKSFTSSSGINVLGNGAGGAIYYQCDSVIQNCQLDIIDKSSFYNNHADFNGGAIDSEIILPKFTGDVTFFNNTAQIYGDNIAAFSQILSVISESQYNQTLRKFGYFKSEELDLIYDQLRKNNGKRTLETTNTATKDKPKLLNYQQIKAEQDKFKTSELIPV